MRVTRLLALAAAATAALWWSAEPAQAEPNETYNRTDAGLPLTNSASQTVLEVQGQRIADFRAAAGGYSAIQRRGIVMRRLTPLLTPPLEASDIQVAQLGREAAILLKGHLLVTVCEADARASNSTAAGLAEQWAQNLRRAILLLVRAPQLGAKAELEPTPAFADAKAAGG